jgi:hypothetical protein
MMLSDMVRGCVCGCVEGVLWYNFVSCAYPEGGPAANKNKHKWGPGGEGKLILEW